MLTFQDLVVFIPSVIAISLIIFGLPFLDYLIARIFIKVWPVAALRMWAMSGINLKSMPDHCGFVCNGQCRNWTCPRYSCNK